MSSPVAEQKPVLSSGVDLAVKVVVADDHALMRSGILHALRQAPDIRVIGEASDGLGALAAIKRELPDVLLLDFHMPRMDGLACLEQVIAQWPDLPVVMLSVEDDPVIARQALARGAVGYILKTIHPADLASMVRTAARKQVLFAGGVGQTRNETTAAPHRADPASGHDCAGGHKPAATPLDHLSDREQEILALVSQGRTNKQIAAELYVTTKTVKFHLTNIFAKLGVANRTEACIFALKSER